MTEHLKAVKYAKAKIKLNKPNTNFIERLKKRDEREKKLARISTAKKYERKTQTEEYRDVRDCWSKVEKAKPVGAANGGLPPLEKKEKPKKKETRPKTVKALSYEEREHMRRLLAAEERR